MEALRDPELPPEPDVSHLVTEDDTPVDNILSEKQMRLFPSILHASWEPGRPFVAMSNVGLFGSLHEPAVVPDTLVSLDVSLPEDVRPKGRRSYFLWVYGKAPDLVIEVVSNRRGEEVEKAERYARLGVRYYVIFDPDRWLGERVLRGYVLHGRSYVELVDLSWLEELGLGLSVWHGRFEDMDGLWLRPCGRDRTLLPLPTELAADAKQEAEEERRRAEEERQRAQEERRRAQEERQRAERAEAERERLRARLRELGEAE